VSRVGAGVGGHATDPSITAAQLVQADFDDVLADLCDTVNAFESEWFLPHLALRFLAIGEMYANGIALALSGSLEPWHVMGEEGASGATVSFVDSSVERLEVKALGMNDNRHQTTVNGVPLPLQPTGRESEFVAGVRFRACQQVSSLHPTIGVHVPRTFDVVATWTGRSIDGSHDRPAGRTGAAAQPGVSVHAGIAVVRHR
jgi:uncharacterized protein (DUF2126 family)